MRSSDAGEGGEVVVVSIALGGAGGAAAGVSEPFNGAGDVEEEDGFGLDDDGPGVDGLSTMISST